MATTNVYRPPTRDDDVGTLLRGFAHDSERTVTFAAKVIRESMVTPSPRKAGDSARTEDSKRLAWTSCYAFTYTDKLSGLLD
ncbi:hypothetical protein S7711_11202 [Stachybotrys chartarum IBT 7711]|uniref:Uncharacterized protein n=1 Tax=Stachybotrys chartarum (strain CBS 109288 / IBT 7711) TaxID=1280523 RepID=A0A084AKS7_STACB|nr:hypothetical protein S7711_11202 [Stachybotrys chartarum IBT 7711]KFA55864.1 hypothetical protein S40293_10563 [Stachybotrys chartarum IBT 40293]